jgi:Domain of unknown function (DUF4386)
MNSNQTTARIAGLLYFIIILTGIFSILYVPSKLIVWDNPGTTFQNIVASETLFRLGILSELVAYTAWLLLPLVLYKLLRTVNGTHAIVMLAFALVIAPLAFVNIGNKFAVLTLISKADYLRTFEAEQLQAQVLLYLRYYNNGNTVASLFWGLWLLPFGYLVYKSEFLPKFIGVLLMLGCFGYVIDLVAGFLSPSYRETIIASYIRVPGSLGEFGICLWLLIMGAKKRREDLNQ